MAEIESDNDLSDEEVASSEIEKDGREPEIAQLKKTENIELTQADDPIAQKIESDLSIAEEEQELSPFARSNRRMRFTFDRGG